jgi:GNAT superfamily N-acetyltransferase
MSINSQIRVRPATIEDKEFILSLVPRLTEFGPPSWRDAIQMISIDIEVLTNKLIDQPDNTAIFIAEDNQGKPLGFIHLQEGSDYYNKTRHGHISDIIIAPEAEGLGIGRVLLEKAEEWAHSMGYRWLTLNVFTQNHHAREVYKRFGFNEDTIKYVKELT